jgi:hypothetical protein
LRKIPLTPNRNVRYERFCLDFRRWTTLAEAKKRNRSWKIPFFSIRFTADSTRRTVVRSLDQRLHYQSHLRRTSRASKSQDPKEQDNEGKDEHKAGNQNRNSDGRTGGHLHGSEYAARFRRGRRPDSDLRSEQTDLWLPASISQPSDAI